MSAQPLISLLEKLLKLHKSLYQIALEKTEILKKGDIEALNNLMKNEQTHIQAIRTIEQQRQNMISEILPEQPEATLTDCLNLFGESEREQAVSIQEQLVMQMIELKFINDLNQQLLEHSLQFVSLNLDLLIPENPGNYTKENEEQPGMTNLSLFDSKA